MIPELPLQTPPSPSPDKKSEEVDSQTHSESIEQELSPEVFDKIMAKVKDIFEHGTGFHNINFSFYDASTQKTKFSEILQNGLLGSAEDSYERSQRLKRSDIRNQKEMWVGILRRSKKIPPLWIDIVGRGINIRQNYIWWLKYTKEPGRKISFLFDISHFQDGVGTRSEYEEKIKQLQEQGMKNPEAYFVDQNKGKKGFYFPDWGSLEDDYSWENASGEARTKCPDYDKGFKLFSRVAPRWLQGIVIHVDDEKNIGKTYMSTMREEETKLVQEMIGVYKKNPDMMLPIYNMYGQLLWPKQMSYDEVREFVSQRGKQKEKE